MKDSHLLTALNSSCTENDKYLTISDIEITVNTQRQNLNICTEIEIA